VGGRGQIGERLEYERLQPGGTGLVKQLDDQLAAEAPSAKARVQHEPADLAESAALLGEPQRSEQRRVTVC
jgi:hypothetical protein